MNSTSESKSKRQKERTNQEEQKKQNKNKVMIYVGVAVAAIAAIAVVGWFLMQPATVSLDSMEKSLKDGHFEDVERVVLSSSLTDAGVVGGIKFTVDGDGHEDLIYIYQFDSAESANAYAATPAGANAIVNGVFLMVDDHNHVLSNDLKNTFNNLTSGKSVHYWAPHGH
jgi:hypothetical protein